MKIGNRTAIMYQEWRSLLFLHWETPSEAIQARLPSGLSVDTFDDKAYLGIVAFYMHGLRPKFLPPFPGVSYFPELNLRTYVRDREGRTGVWFFSLDAHSPLSVLIAQKAFGLPYRLSRMSYHKQADGTIEFTSEHKNEPTQSFVYRPTKAKGRSRKGTLDHFLVERYRLFTTRGDALVRGELYHDPYELHDVAVGNDSKDLFSINGFPVPAKPPDHAVFSERVKVEVYPFVTSKA